MYVYQIFQEQEVFGGGAQGNVFETGCLKKASIGSGLKLVPKAKDICFIKILIIAPSICFFNRYLRSLSIHAFFLGSL